MAYTRTNWTDGTTPVDMSNLSKIEDALEDQDYRIDENTEEIESLKSTVINMLSTGYVNSLTITVTTMPAMIAVSYSTYLSWIMFRTNNDCVCSDSNLVTEVTGRTITISRSNGNSFMAMVYAVGDITRG